jgi:hypothetical protein
MIEVTACRVLSNARRQATSHLKGLVVRDAIARSHALTSIVARSKGATERPDTLMQEPYPPDRQRTSHDARPDRACRSRPTSAPSYIKIGRTRPNISPDLGDARPESSGSGRIDQSLGSRAGGARQRLVRTRGCLALVSRWIWPSRIPLHDAMAARSLETAAELPGLIDRIERPNLSTVDDALFAEVNPADQR